MSAVVLQNDDEPISGGVENLGFHGGFFLFCFVFDFVSCY